MMQKDIHRWIEEIRRYNRLLHLVSENMIGDLEDNVCNTMKLLEHIHEPAIADLGSGSGLPAIPYKIMYPESSVTMIERSQKKCTFLRHIIDTLKLEDIFLIEEDPLTGETKRFDALMSRAFSPLMTLGRLAIKTARPGSRLYYLYTGRHNPLQNQPFFLINHLEHQFNKYTMNLDIYEIISRQ
ncbi:MAG TPA: hypothetical protein ENN05_05770 [Deltaproteobacteria bacterium]|nr:hypothetical protein [Deltaproteobacteria bacterium]